LKDAVLIGAILIGANLSSANLSGAKLISANLKGATVNKTLFRDNSGLWEEVKLDLIKQGALFEDSTSDRP
jgi:uncharacterized protein YjbI with pentapeptide repeats